MLPLINSYWHGKQEVLLVTSAIFIPSPQCPHLADLASNAMFAQMAETKAKARMKAAVASPSLSAAEPKTLSPP